MMHTPGPWKVGVFNANMVYPENGKTAICECAGMHSQQTRWANARLIASAPTTTAWLEWVRNNLITDDNYPSDVTIDGLTLDEAIAKARGEA